MNRTDIISLFRDLIRVTGIYQKDLAKILGVSDRYMKRLMAGYDQPSQRLLKKIGIITKSTYHIDNSSGDFQKFLLTLSDMTEINGHEKQKLKKYFDQLVK